MRDIIRLVMFAIIIFAVSAMAALLSDGSFASSLYGSLGWASTDVPTRLEDGASVVRIRRPPVGVWVGLRGFPSQTTLRFPVPSGLSITNAQVQLNLRTELVEQGDGLLDIAINGEPQDAVVLERGVKTLQLTYPLMPVDLAAGEVLVELSADGTTNSGQICPTNATNLGSSITVEDTSGLVLALDATPSDIETRLALLSEPLTITSPDAPAFSAWAAQWLSRQNVPARLGATTADQTLLLVTQGPDALTSAENGQITLAGMQGVETLADGRGATLPPTYGSDWPLPISALTSDLETHTFRGSSRWTLTYKLADLPDGLPPEKLSLHLRTSQLTDDNEWSLRVLLNGQIVHAANHPNNSETIDLDIPLPLNMQDLTNNLTIVLVDNTPNQGICRAGREAAAQLLPASQLERAAAPEGAKQNLVAKIAQAGGVLLTGPTAASTSAAIQTSGLLDLILPLNCSAFTVWPSTRHDPDARCTADSCAGRGRVSVRI